MIINHIFKTLPVAVASGIFFVGVAFADTDKKTSQTESSETKKDVPVASSDVRELEAFEVSALRFGQSIFDVPVSAKNISSVDIEESGAASITEILRREGNIYFRNETSNSNQGDISMRGFGENSGQRVLVLLDGQRLNRLDMSPINWSQIPLEEIENIEILRGPQSAMYGNYAVGGVVKISTKKWNLPYAAKVGGFYGTYEEYSAWGRAAHSTEDYYATADVNYYHNGGYRDDSLTWSKFAGISAGARLDSKNELNFSANLGDEFMRFPLPKSSYQEMQDNPRSSAGISSEGNSNYGMLSLGWENNSNIGEGAAQLGAVMRDRKVVFPGFSSSQNELWTISFTPRYKFNIDKEETTFLEVGADFYYDNMGHDTYLSPKFANLGGLAQIDRATVAPWVGGKYQINETFSVNAGGRYEMAINDVDYKDVLLPINSYRTNDTVNGFSAQFGLNAKISKQWNAYFKFDQVYRYPAIDESASYYAGFGPGFYNDNLKPERGQNYEIGLNFAEGGWTANGNIFYMYLEDEIAYNPATYANENIGNTDRLGSELSVAYDYDKFAGASTSWTFMMAQFAEGSYEGKKVPLVPSVISSTQVWVRPVEFAKIAMIFQWVGEQYTGSDWKNDFEKMPSFWTLDLVANIRFCDYAKMFVSLNNITDEYYASSAYTYSGAGWMSQSWYPCAGRTVRVGLEVKF